MLKTQVCPSGVVVMSTVNCPKFGGRCSLIDCTYCVVKCQLWLHVHVYIHVHVVSCVGNTRHSVCVCTCTLSIYSFFWPH